MARFSFDNRNFILVEVAQIPSGVIIPVEWNESICNIDSVSFYLSDDSNIHSCSLYNLVAVGTSGYVTLKLNEVQIQSALQYSTKLQILVE